MTTTTRPADHPTALADEGPAAPRPVRLRPAVHVSTVPDGLLVVGWQSRVLVSGGTALHRLWTAIGPHLNNGVDPSVLIAALPEAARATVEQLVDRLGESGMLVPVRGTLTTGEVPAGASSPTVQRLLEFLDSAADSPQDAWAALRTSTVLVTGSGPVADRAAHLLRDHGLGSVVRAGADADRPAAYAGRPDLVLVTDDVPPPDGALAVHVLCLRDRALVLPAGTEHRPDQVRAQLSEHGIASGTGPVPVTVAMLAAAQAVVQVIYALASIRTEFDGQLISIQADRLRISHHPLWPDTRLTAQPVHPGDRAPDDAELLVELTDPLTGLLPEALPEAWPQNPFAVAVTGDETVLGAGVTGAAARYRAALESARRLLVRQAGLPQDAVTGAGADASQFVVDVLTRLIVRGLGTDLVVGAAGPTLSDPDRTVVAARHRLTTVTGDHAPTVEHLRLRSDPDLLAVAVLRERSGSLLALALGRDPADALVRAADHAAARAQCEGRGQCVAQLGLAADLPEEARPWTGELDRLARAVTGTPVSELPLQRVGDAHPLGRLGILGWLATPEVVS